MLKVGTTKTVRVEIQQLLCGRSCGDHGPECTKIVGTPRIDGATVGGLPMYAVLGEQLGEGSIVEVTVKVIKVKKLKKNPWLFDSRGRRKP